MYMKVKNLLDGSIAIIGKDKFKKERALWEELQEAIEEIPEVVEEFEMSYYDLKKKLTELGVRFRKNAPKATLQELYDKEVAG